MGQASCTNNTVVLRVQWKKSFWSRSWSPKRLDFAAGAGAKNFRCLELEPESEPKISVPAPQPCFTSNTQQIYRSKCCWTLKHSIAVTDAGLNFYSFIPIALQQLLLLDRHILSIFKINSAFKKHSTHKNKICCYVCLKKSQICRRTPVYITKTSAKILLLEWFGFTQIDFLKSGARYENVHIQYYSGMLKR